MADPSEKVLYLLRHAKSSWDDPSLADHDRPLDERGREAAPVVGRHMRQAGLRPARVLCSSARRARQTWKHVAAELAYEPVVETRRDLYDAGADALLRGIRALEEGPDSVMLVGHNPAIEDLAVRLAGDGLARALKQMRKKYPTAALAELRFAVGRWTDVAPGDGYLARFTRPKDLGSG